MGKGNCKHRKEHFLRGINQFEFSRLEREEGKGDGVRGSGASGVGHV